MDLYNETGTIALHLKVGLSGWVLLDTFTDHWIYSHLDTTTVPFPPHPSVFTCSVQVTEASYTVSRSHITQHPVSTMSSPGSPVQLYATSTQLTQRFSPLNRPFLFSRITTDASISHHSRTIINSRNIIIVM